jgi:hypothetical protein
MLPINFLRNTTFGDSSLHAAMAMSAASLSTRVSLVPAVNQAATQTCKLHPLNLQSTLPAAVAMVLLDAALAISPQSLSSQSQNDFADAHGLGMPVDPKAGSASGLKRSRDEEKDFDSEVGIPGRHGVGKSPPQRAEETNRQQQTGATGDG